MNQNELIEVKSK